MMATTVVIVAMVVLVLVMSLRWWVHLLGKAEGSQTELHWRYA